jgi:O-antigen/teichoic acid export membrane protein
MLSLISTAIKRLDVHFPEFRRSVVLTAGLSVLNLSNYLFHFVVARIIGPAEYGLVVALLALVEPLNQPFTPLRMLFAERVASVGEGRRPAVIRHLLRLSGKWMAVLIPVSFALLFLLRRPIETLLNASAPEFPFLLALILQYSFVFSLASGLIEGQERFGRLSIGGVVVGVVRLLVGIVAAVVGWGAVGVIAASPVSYLVASVVLLVPLFAAFRQPDGEVSFAGSRDMLPYYLYLTASQILLALVINVDTIMARRLFNADTAGLYAALSILGKSALYLPGAVGIVLFPSIVRQLSEDGHDRRPLQIVLPSLALALILAAVVPLIFALVPKIVVDTLYGPQYPAIIPILWLYAVAILPLVLIMIVSKYFLAVRHVVFPALLAVTLAAKILLLVFFHQTLKMTTLIVGLSNLCAALVLFAVLALMPGRPYPGAARDQPA